MNSRGYLRGVDARLHGWPGTTEDRSCPAGFINRHCPTEPGVKMESLELGGLVPNSVVARHTSGRASIPVPDRTARQLVVLDLHRVSNFEPSGCNSTGLEGFACDQ